MVTWSSRSERRQSPSAVMTLLLATCFGSSLGVYDPSSTPSSISLRETRWMSEEKELLSVGKKSALLVLQSPNSRFFFGLFSESCGIFSLSIYDSKYPLENKPVFNRVWSATDKKGVPVMVKEGGSLHFGEDGNLALYHSSGTRAWETMTSNKTVARVELQDSGNLVLYDSSQLPVWQSFDFPSNLMLPGQILSPGMKLVNGIFTLKMEIGGLVLYTGSSVKWLWSYYDVGDVTGVIYTSERPTYAMFTEKGLHLSQDTKGDFSGLRSITVSKEYKAAGLRLSNIGTLHIDIDIVKPKRWTPRRLLKGLRLSPTSKKFPRPASETLTLEQQNKLKHSDGPAAPPEVKETTGRPNQKRNVTIGTIVTVASLTLSAALCIGMRLRKKEPNSKDILTRSTPSKLSFRKVRKITNNFSSKLGDGGFGTVYEGTLKDGSKVAVKTLERSSTQGEKEFKTEVSVMAMARHLNVVRLRGYCVGGFKRILIYDFMPNSSLDKWLFITPGKDCMLDWTRRFNIAVGTARGLAYLHEECAQKIIHLDVKPENILLDQDFVPKISDFGLAKLIDRDKSRVVTNMRGTPGYLAPEWMQGSALTAKADVYSFGMVLLELICGRETIDISRGSEQWYLPAWAVRLVEEGRTLDLIDQQLHEQVEYFYQDQAKRSIRVALCCIQEDPTRRPTMGRVVQMLEGLVEPKIPQLSRLNVQPACAATRVKDNLVAFAEAVAGEGSDMELVDGPAEGSWKLDTFVVASARTVVKARSVPCIPPWPLKGDIVVVRGSQTKGDLTHAVVRDVKVRTQQVRLAVINRTRDDEESSKRWAVVEEESVWRQWNVLLRTLEFWVPVKWDSLPGGGPQKYPVEWIAN